MARPVVLWDIDGTILDTKGAGVTPLSNAISCTLKRPVSFDREKYSGLSDFEIIDLVSHEHGSRTLTSQQVNTILELYANALRDALDSEAPVLLAECQKTLAFTLENELFSNGILSGNSKQGGEVKLTSAQVSHFFPTKNRFFASYQLKSRIQILGLAKKNHENIVLIGDTPNDIQAGQAFDVPVVSVPTGVFSWDILNDLNPGKVLSKNWTRDEMVEILLELTDV